MKIHRSEMVARSGYPPTNMCVSLNDNILKNRKYQNICTQRTESNSEAIRMKYNIHAMMDNQKCI